MLIEAPNSSDNHRRDGVYLSTEECERNLFEFCVLIYDFITRKKEKKGLRGILCAAEIQRVLG